MEMLERLVLRHWILDEKPPLFTIRGLVGLHKQDLFNNMNWTYTSFGEAAMLNDIFQFKIK